MFGSLLAETSEKEQAKDYSGAVKNIETIIAKFEGTPLKIDALNENIEDFKKIIESNSDLAIKQSGLKFIDLLKQKNTVIVKFADDSKQLLRVIKTYYEQLASGKTDAYLDDNLMVNLTREINDASKGLEDLTPKINAAQQELASIAGIKLKEIK